jgi:hypothetical protein
MQQAEMVQPLPQDARKNFRNCFRSHLPGDAIAPGDYSAAPMRHTVPLLAALLSAAWLCSSAWPESATSLKSFEGIEEPQLRCIPGAAAPFEPDDFVNITDAGENAVRMTLRYEADKWWDSDRDRHDTSRQRAEVKGLGPHQKTGETFEYATTWRSDPHFHGTGRFCHIFQLKATDGDNGAPLIVLSILNGADTAAVRFWPGDSRSFVVARQFKWKPDTWQTVKIRVTTSTASSHDGAVLISVDGDDFQGVRNVSVFRPDATDYRPKWGLYRGITKDLPEGASFIEHRNASARKL